MAWALAVAAAGAPAPPAEGRPLYAFATHAISGSETLQDRFPEPPGFVRTPAPEGSFAQWLRGLPMRAAGAPVHLHTGVRKTRQDAHAGVVAIDTGPRDLQQCADAVMRLRAEWLFASRRLRDIAFTMTQGGRVPFSRWARGERPSPSGMRWTRRAPSDGSYRSFRAYMDFVFAYAGTASLEKELKPVAIEDLAIGDVFIMGGFPGHAVLVADVAENTTTRAKRFLLLQSYMPAQEIHVLLNPGNGDGSPWYAPPQGDLVTPEWTFTAGTLRRWPAD